MPATGHSGKVFKIAPDGKSSLALECPAKRSLCPLHRLGRHAVCRHISKRRPVPRRRRKSARRSGIRRSNTSGPCRPPRTAPSISAPVRQDAFTATIARAKPSSTTTPISRMSRLWPPARTVTYTPERIRTDCYTTLRAPVMRVFCTIRVCRRFVPSFSISEGTIYAAAMGGAVASRTARFG